VEAEEKQTESRTVTPPAAPKPKREENPQVSEHTQSFLLRKKGNTLSFRKHFPSFVTSRLPNFNIPYIPVGQQ